MRFIGSESRRVSPYIDELVSAQSVQRLANLLSILQTSSQITSDGFNFMSPEMQSLLDDGCSVRQEYGASPDDIQLALQTNDEQLVVGAMISDL